MTANAALIAGLNAFTSALEARPDLPAPYAVRGAHFVVANGPDQVASTAAITSAFPCAWSLVIRRASRDLAVLRGDLGGFGIEISADARAVCVPDGAREKWTPLPPIAALCGPLPERKAAA